MIELYTAGTPNGHKISIMLEECGLPYKVFPIDMAKGEQFAPDFLKISPNNKIPAIVDRDAERSPQSVFESGAILIYLAERTGKFLPTDPRLRIQTLEWLFFQMASVGPMFGQFGHFVLFAKEKVPYAIERYKDEALRILGVMDRRLADREYLVDGHYTIADIACFSWTNIVHSRLKEFSDQAFPNVAAWLVRIAGRPAVQKGLAIPTDAQKEAARRAE